MKVVLITDIEKLGEIGDVVEVKPGYARNYLLPRKYALEYNKHNVEVMTRKKAKIQKELELEKLSATEQKEKLEELTVVIKKKAGENDVLFGSVGASDIVEALEQLGVKVEKKKIDLEHPIKRLGDFTCQLRLFKDISAEIKIEIVNEEEEEETPKQ